MYDFFKLDGIKTVSTLAILSCFIIVSSFFLLSLPFFFSVALIATIGIILLAFSYYFFHNHMFEKFLDSLHYLKQYMQDFSVPKHVRKEVMKILGDVEGKTIFEYGSGVGTLTLDLAKMTGNKGKVFASDISKGEIAVLNNRLSQNDILNVTSIHDPSHSERISPLVSSFDIFLSIESLGYAKDSASIVHEAFTRMPVGGKICIVEYVDLYKIVPNTAWLSNLDSVYRMFKKNGFVVRVVKKHGWFWNYLYIYGVKGKHVRLPRL